MRRPEGGAEGGETPAQRAEGIVGIGEEFGRERGPIVTSDGQPVALSTEVGGDYQYLRQYPGGQVYAHATGFFSIVYGRTAIESVQNDVLAGTADSLFYSRIGQVLTGEDPAGGTAPPKISVTVTPAKAKDVAGIDAATVQVRFTTTTRKNVLTVPVGALVALGLVHLGRGD